MSTDCAILLKSYIDSLALVSIMNNLQPETKYIFLHMQKKRRIAVTTMSEWLWKLISRADIKKYTKDLKNKFEVESGFECESTFGTKINIRETIFQIIRHAVNI